MYILYIYIYMSIYVLVIPIVGLWSLPHFTSRLFPVKRQQRIAGAQKEGPRKRGPPKGFEESPYVENIEVYIYIFVFVFCMIRERPLFPVGL